MRRRPVAASSDADDSVIMDDNDEPLDEDEQEQTVQELQQQIEKQQKQMKSMFAVLCRIAAVASLLLVMLDDPTTNQNDATSIDERESPLVTRDRVALLLRWMHGLFSAALHWTAMKTTTTTTISTTNTMDDKMVSSSTLAPQNSPPNSPKSVIRASSAFPWHYCHAILLATNIVMVMAMVLPSSSSSGAISITGSGLGLAVSNVLTLGVKCVLQWDERDSYRALHELAQAQYRHKTL